MAKSLNKIFLIGNLGADPEALRYTPAGASVLNLRMATNETWKDKQTGERQQHTEWHRLVIYGQLAETVQQRLNLRKGSTIWVEGRTKTREWDKDGQKQSIKEVIVSEILVLDSRNSTGESNWDSPSHSAPSRSPQPSTPPQEDPSFADDDIPF